MFFLAQLALLLLLSFTFLPSAAEARPDTRKMTCSEAKAFVRKKRQVVMTTGFFTYNRFVKSRRYCQRDEVLRREFARTKDEHKCRVAYICVNPRRDSDRDTATETVSAPAPEPAAAPEAEEPGGPEPEPEGE